jgi:hypothetical protein
VDDEIAVRGPSFELRPGEQHRLTAVGIAALTDECDHALPVRAEELDSIHVHLPPPFHFCKHRATTLRPVQEPLPSAGVPRRPIPSRSESQTRAGKAAVFVEEGVASARLG